jgi:hypothetical protein
MQPVQGSHTQTGTIRQQHTSRSIWRGTHVQTVIVRCCGVHVGTMTVYFCGITSVCVTMRLTVQLTSRSRHSGRQQVIVFSTQVTVGWQQVLQQVLQHD